MIFPVIDFSSRPFEKFFFDGYDLLATFVQKFCMCKTVAGEKAVAIDFCVETEFPVNITGKTSLNNMFAIKNLVKMNFYRLLSALFSGFSRASSLTVWGKWLLLLLIVVAGNQKLSAKPFQFKRELTYTGAKVTFLESQKYYRTVLEKINGAKKQVDIGMYLFKITKNQKNYANQLLECLLKAARRGVRVKVLLDQSDFNISLNRENSRTARRLRNHRNIDVCFDQPNVQSHLKLVVVDQHWTFLGSHNWSFSALNYNNEFSVMVTSRPFGKKAVSYLKQLRKEHCSRYLRR